VTVAIRPVTSDDDRQALADLVNAVTPEDPTSLDDMAWSDATYPGTTRLLAERDGCPVGAATAGRIYVLPLDHPELWGSIVVLPDARRQGIGARLLAAISDHAAAQGKSGLRFRAWEDRPEGVAFLEHRGYREAERSRMVRLTLAGLEATDAPAPDGVRLTTLADRPDLVGGVHAVALEAFADIPGDEPMAVGDLAEFRARDVDRPGIAPGAFIIAVDPVTDRVVGYASLMLLPGDPTVAWHDMTAVARAWRGRGIATALKRATIDWAIRRGLRALDTGNDVENLPMRSVNARLGYEPLPDEIVMRGPLIRT
jgi:GNAT superfamily N-acetyltransferase